MGHGSLCGACFGIPVTGEGVWGPDAASGVRTGHCLLRMGPDVPYLRAAAADSSEGIWQGVLLWFLFMCILYGEGTHTAAAGADHSRRLEGAADGAVGRDDAPPWWRRCWQVLHTGVVPTVAPATIDA